MNPPPYVSGRRSKIAWIASALATGLILFFVENLWMDTKLRDWHHRIPSLIPHGQSGSWFVILGIAIITFLLSATCLVLLFRDRSASVSAKLCATILVVSSFFLGAQWSLVTNGQRGLVDILNHRHPVLLTWSRSASPVMGYNVYRKEMPNGVFLKLNSVLVQKLDYTDNLVPTNALQSGVTYSYMVRAVDIQGRESADSNEATVVAP